MGATWTNLGLVIFNTITWMIMRMGWKDSSCIDFHLWGDDIFVHVIKSQVALQKDKRPFIC